MRFSVALLLAIVPVFAAPLPVHYPRADGILGGLVSAIKGAIQDPALTKSRLEVAIGLASTLSTLQGTQKAATASGNAEVVALVTTAIGGVKSAQGAVGNIGKAIISGAKPNPADQKTTAQGIATAEGAINQMESAVTTPDATLSSSIADAQSKVAKAVEGGNGVLAAQNLTPEDVGLNADGSLPAAGAAATAPPATAATAAASSVAAASSTVASVSAAPASASAAAATATAAAPTADPTDDSEDTEEDAEEEK